MSNDGKHHFHLKEYAIFNSATFICRHIASIKVSELNTTVLLQMEMELQVPIIIIVAGMAVI